VSFSCFLFVVEEYQGKTRTDWQDDFAQYQTMLDSVLDAMEEDHRVVWDSPDGIGVLCFEADDTRPGKDEQKNIAKQLRNLLAAKVPEVTISIGISEPSANLADIRARYRQAGMAADTGRKVWPQAGTYHYLDMGVFQLLSRFTEEDEITEYIERNLGNLLRYDQKKHEAYLDTLEVILMSDNLKEGADKLFIHYQTLLFRRQRMEKILEVSFDDFATRMAILTALHLLKLRKN